MEKIPELPVTLKPYDVPKLPEVARQYHVSPNTFLQSAMFGMVQRGRRKYLDGYSGENGQWLCRESGRRYAVKKAAIPVKTARV